MSIESFIKRVCVQPAVYWGNPVVDGYGGTTFDDPREIKCRWDWMDRIRETNNGKQFHQKGQALVTEDLSLEGWLYLGSLNDLDLDSNDYINPMSVQGAFQIIGFNKTSLVRSTTKFVREVMFGFGNAQY